MTGRVVIDGTSRDLAGLGARARELARDVRQAEAMLREAEALRAALTRAKNAYIADLHAEIVRDRAGVALGALVDGD
jgi:hypothetical protein